jgi:hypothetical protein
LNDGEQTGTFRVRTRPTLAVGARRDYGVTSAPHDRAARAEAGLNKRRRRAELFTAAVDNVVDKPVGRRQKPRKSAAFAGLLKCKAGKIRSKSMA